MRAGLGYVIRFLYRASQVILGLATVIAAFNTVADSLPIIGNVVTWIMQVAQPLSKLSVFDPLVLALLLLPMVLVLRLLAERLGLTYTDQLTWSEVLFSIFGLLPFAGVWLWLYITEVPLWSSGLFVVGYLGTVVLAIRISVNVSNPLSVSPTSQTRLVSIVFGAAIIIILVLKGAVPVADLQNLHNQLDRVNPLLFAGPLLAGVFALTMLIERHGFIYRADFQLSSVLFDCILLLPFAGVWLWLYITEVPLWSGGLFVVGYLCIVILGSWIANHRTGPSVRIAGRSAAPTALDKQAEADIRALALAFKQHQWRYAILQHNSLDRWLFTAFDRVPLLFLATGRDHLFLIVAPVRTGLLEGKTESNVMRYIEEVNRQKMIFGRLEYDPNDGEVLYGAALMLTGGSAGRKQLENVIREAVVCVKRYGPSIIALASGSTTLQQALEELN